MGKYIYAAAEHFRDPLGVERMTGAQLRFWGKWAIDVEKAKADALKG